MNKNRFRIIFNQLRGLMMVVAENVKSHTASAESGTNSKAASLSPSFTKNQSDMSVTVRPLALLNRDVHVNEHGEAVDSQGNSTANTIAPIFDAEKVAKEINAQMEITQAFSQHPTGYGFSINKEQ
jgi:filamentous hemagglutinin